ncbi:hypothetical protein QJQ45_008286 [Haematococcus lacustris]|nr:hypothetical protein QJQ45_008286 [Haematococcus lacustris]
MELGSPRATQRLQMQTLLRRSSMATAEDVQQIPGVSGPLRKRSRTDQPNISTPVCNRMGLRPPPPSSHGHFAPELQTVAQRVLCIPATAAANERVFSAFSHVWSDKRASLILGRMWVMAYIYFNNAIRLRGPFVPRALVVTVRAEVRVAVRRQLAGSNGSVSCTGIMADADEPEQMFNPPGSSNSRSSAAAAHAVGLPHIGNGIAEQREFAIDPATRIGVGIDLDVTQAVSAASGVWDLEKGQLLEDMAEVSMERLGHAKQLVVFLGAASIGTGGGWGADAVLWACCKVVCRPRGTDLLWGRVVLVDEHSTSRWPPAIPQPPCSSQAATQPTASEPGPSTPLRAKRSDRTKADQAAEPKSKACGWDRDCNAAQHMQRIGESRWRPLELCYWPDKAALPAKGKE